MDYHKLCLVTIKYIKNKIGIGNNDFDTYKEFMSEKGMSGKAIFKDVLSDGTVKVLLKKAEIRDIPDMRKNPNGPSKNRMRAFNCLLVISLILLICHNYECLRKNIEKEKNVSEKQVRNLIKAFTPYLKKINPNYNIKKWLPDSTRKEFTLSKIKKIVKELGIKFTGKPGKIIRPKTEEEFNNLRENLSVKPSLVPIVIKCGECGYKWETNADRLNQNQWCKPCRKNIYDFKKTKNLVEKTGLNKTGVKGILRSLKSEVEYDRLKENLGCWYCRIPLEVECGLCGKIWTTNAERLQQKHWCPKCVEGEYEQITRWYLEKILSFILKKKIRCPRTRLSKVIKCYNENNHNEDEKNVIKHLIKFGHFDCYIEICINCKVFKIALEYQGGQHKKIVSKFHHTKEDLAHQKLLDKLKRKLCREKGIILLEFPYDIDKYMNNNVKIQKYIIKELKCKTNIQLPSNFPLYNHNTPEFGQYRLDHYL